MLLVLVSLRKWILLLILSLGLHGISQLLIFIVYENIKVSYTVPKAQENVLKSLRVSNASIIHTYAYLQLPKTTMSDQILTKDFVE